MDDRRLNELLDDWRLDAPGAHLRVAILARAPKAVRPGVPFAWRIPARLWLAGAGLAAGVAGVSCGAIISTAAVREQRDEALVAAVVSDGALAAPASEPVRSL